MSTGSSPFSLVIPTFVQSVHRGFHKNFWPFANTHYGDWLLTWHNSQCIPKNADEAAFLQEQIDKEVQLGRYSQPFDSDLLPGMYSIHIHAVPNQTSLDFSKYGTSLACRMRDANRSCLITLTLIPFAHIWLALSVKSSHPIYLLIKIGTLLMVLTLKGAIVSNHAPCGCLWLATLSVACAAAHLLSSLCSQDLMEA